MGYCQRRYLRPQMTMTRQAASEARWTGMGAYDQRATGGSWVCIMQAITKQCLFKEDNLSNSVTDSSFTSSTT